MIQFEWLWAFLFIPFPVLVWGLLKPVQIKQAAALRVPFIDEYPSQDMGSNKKATAWTLRLLAVLCWLLLVISVARPQWLGDPVSVPFEGRDLMLAVDLSGSMQEKDFVVGRRWVNRLAATKVVASEFIDAREGDRLGLILFGTHAYLQTPLTFDRKTVKTLLNESFIKLAGEQTAIGDAIGLAVKRLSQHNDKQPVLILLTDGSNTAGEIDPVTAAKLAAQKHIKIYTIGVGGQPRQRSGIFGLQGFNRSDLDEKTLKAIASATGGRYFRAKDTQSLSEIYDLVDQLESSESDNQTFRPVHSLYPWPLALAFGLALVILGIKIRRNI